MESQATDTCIKQSIQTDIVCKILVRQNRFGKRQQHCLLQSGIVCPAWSVCPVIGLKTLRPLLEHGAAFKQLTEPVLEQICLMATTPALSFVSMQTATHMNRARCLLSLGHHREAAQDLTLSIALWDCLQQSQSPSDTTQTAVATGIHTCRYLRAKTRLYRGLAKAAAADVREALCLNPPLFATKQLEELQGEIWAKAGERHRVREPLARELAKVIFALRAASIC